jgi:FkbM family methyltransferase
MSTADADPPGGRRAFLLGSLVGVGATAGLTQAARLLREAADEEEQKAKGPDDASRSSLPSRASAPAPLGPGEIPPPPEDVGPMPPDGRRLSYAQQGEDLVLKAIFERLKIARPRYLDIGAFHPSISSNTFLFYVLGSRGVLVEPNPLMASLLARARPEDVVLDVGVSFDGSTEADYYVIRDRPQLNTFSKEQADRYVAESGPQTIERVVKMPLRSIDGILEEHFAKTPPDLLSVDVEGLDLPLLRSMSFDRSRPAVICVETLVYGTAQRRAPILELLQGHGYQVTAGTFVNTIFVDGQRLAG